MIARVWHGVIAVLVVLALVLQVIIAVRLTSSPHSTVPGVVRGSSLVGRMIRVISFFTVQSNILSGVVSVQLAIRPTLDGRRWRLLRLAALVGITVTGIVYSTVLARIHEPHGTAETLSNALVHYAVPAMMVVGWLAFGPRPRIDRTSAFGSLCFPAAWLVYTLLRGAIWKWYPYPFLDVVTHGYAHVALNSVVVCLVLLLVAGLFWAGDRFLPPAPPRRHAHVRS